jgi:excisionase family DNA binding protein
VSSRQSSKRYIDNVAESEQRLLTVGEVAERIRSSPETVRRWLRQGKLRGFRPGGTKLGYRVPESELQCFLTELNQGRSLSPKTEGSHK